MKKFILSILSASGVSPKFQACRAPSRKGRARLDIKAHSITPPIVAPKRLLPLIMLAMVRLRAEARPGHRRAS